MKEIIDGDEGKDGTEEADIFDELIQSKHLPDFKFDGYPTLVDEDDGINSPRIRDEIWSNYESQSTEEPGANQLRQNAQLQDLIIKALQVSPQELAANRTKLQ